MFILHSFVVSSDPTREKHLEDHDYKAWNPTMQHLMVSPETVRLPMNAYGVCQGYWEEYIKSRF